MTYKHVFLGLWAVVASFGISQSYLFAGNMGWEQQRSPGDPIDGFWYTPQRDDGCFRDSIVFKIENGRVFYAKHGRMMDGLMKHVESGGISYMYQELAPNDIAKFYLRDEGQEIWITKVDALYNGKRSISEEPYSYIRTCDNPTLKGILLSFFQDVFDPDEPIITVNEMR